MRSTRKPVTSLAAKLCSPSLQQLMLRFWLLGALLIPLTAWSQSADIAGKGKSDDAADTGEDSSQQVEESEEAYRRRMETDESGDQSTVILDRSTPPLKPLEGMAALPYESQKHLRDEMRDVIIEQGEWKPEDVNANYPYTPSAAAEKDPELRQKEEAAWGDLVQEYHKREAAALAGGGGRSSGSGPEQDSGQNGGGQSGSRGQSGMAGSESSKSGSKGSSSPGARPETDAASSTAAGAGVSQSALEFLRGQSTGQSAGTQSAGDQPAGSPSARNQASAGQVSSGATMPAEGAKKPLTEEQQVAEAARKPAEESQTSDSESAEPPPPPGSIAIAQLEELEKGQKAESEKQPAENQQAQQASKELAAAEGTTASSSQVTSSQQQDQPSPPPGTIAIPELEKLQGMEEAAPLPIKKTPN